MVVLEVVGKNKCDNIHTTYKVDNMGLGDVNSSGLQVDQTALRRILACVASKKATYPSEIEKATGIDRKTINRMIYDLKKGGVIEPLTPKFKHSDQRLLERRREIWQNGKMGIKSFRKMNWFSLNNDLQWYLKVKNREIYVNEYHRPYDRLEVPENPEGVTSKAVELIRESNE